MPKAELKEPKSIQVIPRDAETDAKIEELTSQLRTSRAGLAGLALDFVVSALTKGTARVVNGEIEIVKLKAA